MKNIDRYCHSCNKSRTFNFCFQYTACMHVGSLSDVLSIGIRWVTKKVVLLVLFIHPTIYEVIHRPLICFLLTYSQLVDLTHS